MATDLDSDVFLEPAPPPPRPLGWLKIGAFAAGSTLAGGLAFAWYYRKTLARLREAQVASDFHRESTEPD